MWSAWNTFWDRLPFLVRLLVTASFALLVAGSSMLLLSARQEARDAQADLREELGHEMEFLPLSLADVIVIGDYSSLQQALEHFVARRHVFRAEFRDRFGTRLASQDHPLSPLCPAWFEEGLGFSPITGRTPISVGGRDYGELIVTMTVQDQANRAWTLLLRHVLILLLALTLDFLGIWLVLRNGLAPLDHLEQGANALAKGRLDARLAEEGSPELRHLISTFNRMAESTQSAQEGLARSNAELQRFAEIAAHHLQEPARRLASYAQRLQVLLSGQTLDEEVQASLNFIQEQARRQQSLVRDVQRYLAAGQACAEPGVADADLVLRDVLQHLRARIEQAGAHVTLGPLPRVRLDPPRLAEIFTLLLENSLHQPGSREIAVRGEVRAGKAYFQVSDDGPGIAPEYRERVFRVFERLSSSGLGTGVGLAIVRRILESAGGRAWIEETPGGGCTVNFELPLGDNHMNYANLAAMPHLPAPREQTP